jgi:hypothetical protein
MKVYDNYEISPCRRYEQPDKTGHFYFEVCEPHKADVWTLYGHIAGEGAEAIGDFSSRDHAAETYSRITGLPFTGSYQADARLRVMHAGPKLLEAAIAAWQRAANHEKPTFEECNMLHAAIAEATGNSAPEPRKPIVIEVRGGVVQDVLNVPSGYEYEIKDYDDIEADEEAAVGRPV